MGQTWASKAAELLCIGLAGPVLSDSARRLLDLGVSGGVLYGNELKTPHEAHRLIVAIKEYAARPVFVAIDHEGGGRNLLHRGFTGFPAMMHLGHTMDSNFAHEVGRVIGTELRAVGVDMVLGPVLDVATNPSNPVIGERSLSADPQLASELGAALIRGIQEEHVAACGKHFPGHGDTVVDSNAALPVLAHGVSRLEDVELRPFAKAIESKVASLLVGHILFHALDPKYPASLSRPILFGLLRQRMNYRGMVLTDDVDMGALTKNFSAEEIAERGIAAGVDCFLCARHPETAEALINAIVRGLDRGTVLPERIEAARRRISALVHRYAPKATSFHPEHIGTHEHAEVLARIRGGRPSLLSEEDLSPASRQE